MQIKQGDLWDYHTPITPVVIMTNGVIGKTGDAIMGKGTALQAAQRFIGLRTALGKTLEIKGNHVFYFAAYNIITFPTKEHFLESSSLNLIEQSVWELVNLTDRTGWANVYLPIPGLGAGNLRWSTVKPIIEWLDDRFILIEKDINKLKD